MNALLQPRVLGLVCATAAVAMGMAYMAAAGAPNRYLIINLAALVLGATAWLASSRIAVIRPPAAGIAVFVLATPLLLTALFGVVVGGASRWVSVGPLNLQISLIVVPVMLVLHARRPDAVGAAGMTIAALALAIQPDRAMAGVLVTGLAAFVVGERRRVSAIPLAAAVLAFGWTLLVPDRLPAVPYVDRIFYTAFDVHLFAGLAVTAGATLLVVPAVIGVSRSANCRPVLLAFGGCWSGVVIAAALGNYPTPLVGYGGSAVLGYLLSVALLPRSTGEGARDGAIGSGADSDPIPDRTTLRSRAVGMA